VRGASAGQEVRPGAAFRAAHLAALSYIPKTLDPVWTVRQAGLRETLEGERLAGKFTIDCWQPTGWWLAGSRHPTTRCPAT
jgi:hypothetical protein